MEAERVTVRLPKKLAAAARKNAGGDGVSVWIRGLIEKATGVAAGKMEPGVVSMKRADRVKAAKKSHEGRRGGK
jgi:hypothetical protein